MKNIIEQAWQYGFKLCFLFALMIPVTAGVSATPTVPEICLTCQVPSVSKTGQTSKSVSFDWNAVSGATTYVVWCTNKTTNNSWAVNTGNTSIDFPGLAPGTYKFEFGTVCGEESSEFVVIDDLIMI